MAGNKDIFAPPSKEELMMFAPPSKEELALHSAPKSVDDDLSAMGGDSGAAIMKQLTGKDYQGVAPPSQWNAYGTGALQGGTFGLSDEMGAMVDTAIAHPIDSMVAAGKMIGGKPADLSSLLPKYREFQKQRESANKQVQQAEPAAYLSGEVTGGIGSTIMTPEITGGSKLLGLAGKYGSKVIPGVDTFLAGKAAGTGAKILGKGVANAIEAAPAGGAYGFGTSEKTVEGDPLGLAKDVGTGIEYGSALGAGVGMGIESGKQSLISLSKMAKNKDYFRQLQAAFELKKPLGDSSTQNETARLPGEYAEDMQSRVKNTRSVLGEDINNSLTSNSDIKVNADKELEKIKQEVMDKFTADPELLKTLDPSTRNLFAQLGQGGFGDMNPATAHKLKNQFYNLSSVLDRSSSPLAYDAQKLGNRAAQAIDGKLKSVVPDYAEAANNWQEFHTKIPETITSKGKPEEIRSTFYGDLKNPDEKIYDTTESMLKGAQLSGTDAAKNRATFDKLHENILGLEQSHPAVADVFTQGDTAEGYFQKLQKQADQLAMLRQAGGKDPEVHPDIFTKGYETASKMLTGSKAPTIGLANKVGMMSQSSTVKMGAKLYNTSNDALLTFAQKLKSNPGTGYVGESLEKALMNKDDIAKNAVLFRMLQDPYYRKLLGLNDDEYNSEHK